MQGKTKWATATCLVAVATLAAIFAVLPGTARADGPDNPTTSDSVVIDGGDGPPTMIEESGASWDASCTGWKFRNTWKLYRGTWPQNHDVFLHTTWCGTGTGGRITYQSSYTTTGQYFCNPSNPYVVRIDGGPGFTTVTVEGGAYFACPSGVPWLQLHYHPWMQIRYYPGGGSSYIAYGG